MVNTVSSAAQPQRRRGALVVGVVDRALLEARRLLLQASSYCTVRYTYWAKRAYAKRSRLRCGSRGRRILPDPRIVPSAGETTGTAEAYHLGDFTHLGELRRVHAPTTHDEFMDRRANMTGSP